MRPGCPNFVTKLDRAKKFCSLKCAVRVNNVTHYSSELVIGTIRKFYQEHRRIPLKYELKTLYAPARQFFGTWNKAISAAGYDPNPVMFAKHHTANDGHRCDSLAEKIVDDWLFARGIPHEVHVPYVWNNGMKCDFKIGEWWVEIFGLAGEHRRYDTLKRKKMALARKYQISLIAISLTAVYDGSFGKSFIS